MNALDRLAQVLTDLERTDAFHQGHVGLSLRAMRRIDRWLGRPLAAIPVIHVGGSKGKGSVCLLAASLLRAQGLTAGVYLSPHVDSWTERIQVGGRPIAATRLQRHLARLIHEVARRGGPPMTVF